MTRAKQPRVSWRRVEGRGTAGQDRISSDSVWQIDQIVQEAESGLAFEAIVTKRMSLTKTELNSKSLRRFRAEQRRAATRAPSRRSARMQGPVFVAVRCSV